LYSITTVLATVRIAAQAKSIHIQIQLSPNLGLFLGDPARLEHGLGATFMVKISLIHKDFLLLKGE
jgi:hypothetical protein